MQMRVTGGSDLSTHLTPDSVVRRRKKKEKKTQIHSDSNQLKGLIISAFQAVNQLSWSNELSVCAPAISDLCVDCLLAPISSLHSISTKVIALCVYHMFSLINVLMTAVRTTLKWNHLSVEKNRRLVADR